MNAMKIENEGRHIKSTDYYGSEYDRDGIVGVSVNAKAFRLLIPGRLAHGATANETVSEMTKKVKYVIASRGIVGGNPVIVFVFDDKTSSPYTLITDVRGFIGIAPAKEDHGREDLTCIGYVQSRDGGIRQAFDMRCKFRWSESKPDISAWKK